MALAYLIGGMTAGSIAAFSWLGIGGSLLGAFGAYAFTGHLAALAIIARSCRD